MASLPVGAASLPSLAAARRGFDHVDTWVFDLDNTLYPASCDLFSQVDQRMSTFIAKTLGVPREHARHLQKAYYCQFGTTLAGLMKVHKLPPGPFLKYVHDIDLSVVPELPDLAGAIAALPGRRLIFTNGSRHHAENVARKLGVLDLFEDICDIAALEYVPKPEREAFDKMLRLYDVPAVRAAMFEDMPHNLEPASTLGMTTVLVHSDYTDHPAQMKIKEWRELPEHIHYLTRNLAAFIANEIIAVVKSSRELST